MKLPRTLWHQIDLLRIDPERPVVICDVDDVVVEYSNAFKTYIAEHGYGIDADRFAVTGNIRSRCTGTLADRAGIKRLRRGFFRDRLSQLVAVPFAAEWLSRLSLVASIVMLSNIPQEFAEHRKERLHAQGISFPLVTNSGAKGPAAAAIAGQRPTVFIDNQASLIVSVHEHVPHAHLVHFVHDANPHWLQSPLPFVALATACWGELGSSVLAYFDELKVPKHAIGPRIT
jgi:hypothetical protein